MQTWSFSFLLLVASSLALVVASLVPHCEKGSMCASSGTTALLFGGQVSETLMRNDSWLLIPSTLTSASSVSSNSFSISWSYATSGTSPASRWKGTLVEGEKKDEFYLFAGSQGYGATEEYYKDVWRCQVNSDKRVVDWKLIHGGEKESNWPVARRAHSAISVSSRMIIFAGKGESGDVLDDLWEFDFKKSTFEPIQASGQAPKKRKGHSACLFTARQSKFNEKWSSAWGESTHTPAMIVFGGRHSGTGYYNDVFALTLDGKPQWILLESGGASIDKASGKIVRPAPRNHHSAVLKDGFMYVFGGRSSHLTIVVHDDFWVFNVVEASWTQLDPLTFPEGFNVPGRMEHCALLMSHRTMLLVGGQDSSGTRRNDVWAYSLEFNRFQQLSQNMCQGAPLPFRAVWFSLLFLLGGVGLIAYKFGYFHSYWGSAGYTRV